MRGARPTEFVPVPEGSRRRYTGESAMANTQTSSHFASSLGAKNLFCSGSRETCAGRRDGNAPSAGACEMGASCEGRWKSFGRSSSPAATRWMRRHPCRQWTSPVELQRLKSAVPVNTSGSRRLARCQERSATPLTQLILPRPCWIRQRPFRQRRLPSSICRHGCRRTRQMRQGVVGV